jgi:cell division protein FtsB
VTEAAEAASLRPRPLRSLVSAAVLFALVALAAAGLKGWRDYEAVRTREQRLENDIAASEQRIRALQRKIERLQKDPVELDRAAREDLGLVSPKDVVIVLPEASPAPPK